MFIRNISFVLFGDFKNLEAQPETILNISSKFLQNGVSVIPGTVQQFNPLFGMKAFERMMFSNSKEKVTIQIGLEAIEINKIIMDNKRYNLASQTEQFLSKVKKIIKSLNESNEKINDGSRVSLLIGNLYDKNNIRPIDEIYTNVNNTLPNYNSEETFEWNTRAAKRNKFRILDTDEEVNVVTEIMRGSGQVNSFGDVQQFDTVQTKIDINTIDSNKSPRVNENFINKFIDSAYDLYSVHSHDLEVRIFESN